MSKILPNNATIADRIPPAPRMPLLSWTWLGVVPFFLFVAAFMLYPTFSIVLRSFLDDRLQPTLNNILDLNQPVIITSYVYTIVLSIVTALLGGFLGFLLAYAITIGKLPSGVRSAVISFSGVASNFAGIPLAFAFIATLGQLGLVTGWLRSLGISIYPDFSLYSFWGLVIVYTYFQIPLMALIMVPALDGLRREWREAAENLGATGLQYWRYVALPVLAPTILGALALLFANAFGTHATAFALVGGGTQATVVTILIGRQLSSDALSNPGLGYALALGMIVIILLTIVIYSWCRRIAERWQR